MKKYPYRVKLKNPWYRLILNPKHYFLIQAYEKAMQTEMERLVPAVTIDKLVTDMMIYGHASIEIGHK